jgi:hypothetical protein
MTPADWQAAAREMQQNITSADIETAIRQMPPEAFALTGPQLIATLEARLTHLETWATDYGRYLAHHVDIPATTQSDDISIKRSSGDSTTVTITQRAGADTLYDRTFDSRLTRDIRVYGLAGEDHFAASGAAQQGPMVRLVGGANRDSFTDQSSVAQPGRQLMYYDDHNNLIQEHSGSRLRLSNNPEVHRYEYAAFEYHKKGIRIGSSYNNPDRLFVGLGYRFGRYRWRHQPYSFDQALYLRYSLIQNAFSVLSDANFYQAFGKWNLRTTMFQDFVRWTNFYGLGNETTKALGHNLLYLGHNIVPMVVMFAPMTAILMALAQLGTSSLQTIADHADRTMPDA